MWRPYGWLSWCVSALSVVIALVVACAHEVQDAVHCVVGQ